MLCSQSVLDLNVGGILYTTTRETLAKVTKNQEDFISKFTA